MIGRRTGSSCVAREKITKVPSIPDVLVSWTSETPKMDGNLTF